MDFNAGAKRNGRNHRPPCAITMSLYDSLLIANDFLIPSPELFNGATSCAWLRKLLVGLGTSSPRSLRGYSEIWRDFPRKWGSCHVLRARLMWAINKCYRNNPTARGNLLTKIQFTCNTQRGWIFYAANILLMEFISCHTHTYTKSNLFNKCWNDVCYVLFIIVWMSILKLFSFIQYRKLTINFNINIQNSWCLL